MTNTNHDPDFGVFIKWILGVASVLITTAIIGLTTQIIINSGRLTRLESGMQSLDYRVSNIEKREESYRHEISMLFDRIQKLEERRK